MKTKWIFFLILFASCFNKKKHNEANQETNNVSPVDIKCELRRDSSNKDKSIQICSYNNGSIKESRVLLFDSIKIDEEIFYYKNGKTLEYNFYDPSGKSRYSRFLDTLGGILQENGDFLAYTEVPSKIQLGQKFKISVYVACPPGCFYEIFAISKEGRYKPFQKTEKRYRQEVNRKADKVGKFTMPIEVEFTDSVNNMHNISKYSVNFNVVN